MNWSTAITIISVSWGLFYTIISIVKIKTEAYNERFFSEDVDEEIE